MMRLLIEHDTHGKIKPTLINNLGSASYNIMQWQVVKQICQVLVMPDLTGALNEKPIKDPKKQ